MPNPLLDLLIKISARIARKFFRSNISQTSSIKSGANIASFDVSACSATCCCKKHGNNDYCINNCFNKGFMRNEYCGNVQCAPGTSWNKKKK